MIATMERELTLHVPAPFVLHHDTNPEIIARIAKSGAITSLDVTDLMRSYMKCLESDTDILINVCSSVGDIADQARTLFNSAGMEILCVDDDMCKQVVKEHQRIGVIATLPSTLSPTCNRLLRHASETNKTVVIKELIADNAFGLSQNDLSELLCKLATKNSKDFDAVLLAQVSMAECEQAISVACGKPTYSSPRFCATAIARHLAGNK